MFISLRGALGHALIAQVWLLALVVSLQRVQEPANLQVRRPERRRAQITAWSKDEKISAHDSDRRSGPSQ
eukprot:3640535-Pyramimonas_sp.AAC.1